MSDIAREFVDLLDDEKIRGDLRFLFEKRKIVVGQGRSSASGDAYSEDKIILEAKDYSDDVRKAALYILEKGGVFTVMDGGNIVVGVTDRCGQTIEMNKKIGKCLKYVLDVHYKTEAASTKVVGHGY